MATDVEKLVVQLSADIKGYQREMLKAANVTNSQARAIEKRMKALDSRFSALGTSMARGLAAPLAGISAALTVESVVHYADAWTSARNSLAVAGVVGNQQVGVLDQIYNSAQRNAAPIEAMADLFGKAAQSGDALGASQADLLKFTDGVGTALKIEGKSATQAQGALMQLGQLLGSTRVQAEEFNSVNEGARPILIAVANGLDAAGGSVGKLKQLVNDGEVSSRDFFQAFLKGLPSIQSMAANATQTIEQGMTKVNNAFTRYIGQTDEGLGASQRLVTGLNALADNFGKTADVVLELASAIAGALVGRSIVGMITNLGLAGTALTRFTAALRAAGTMAGFSTALNGIGAAAGPIGAIIGGTVVGALALFAASSSQAAGQAKAVAGELEDMGLLAKQAAPPVDDLAKSLSGLTDVEKLRKIREFNAEMERLKGGGLFSFGDAGDEFGSIIESATGQLKGFGGLFTSTIDQQALVSIVKLADGFRDGEIAADAALARLKEIAATDVSKPVLELNQQLQRSIQTFEAAKTGALALGDTSAIDAAKAGITALMGQMDMLANAKLITGEQLAEVQAIIDKFQAGKASAGETRQALEKIGSANLDASPLLQKMQTLLAAVQQVGNEAVAAQAKLGGLLDPQVKAAYQQYGQSRAQGEEMVRLGKAYADEAARQNALSKHQLAVEKEIARIKTDLQKAGGVMTDDQISSLAQSNVAAEERRSKSGSASGSTGEKGQKATADDRLTMDLQSIRDRTAALIAEQQAVGQSYREQEKRRMALDLEAQALQDVREEARRKGDQDWQNAKLSPDQIGKIDAASDAYAEQADALRKVQDAQQRAQEAAQGFYDTFKTSMIDAITGADSFADALSNVAKKLGDLLLNSAFDSLLGGATGSGGGLTGVFKALGFASGGYTGEGGKYEPAGVVHKGEYVFDQASVRAAGGPGALDAMRKGLKGYASGGYVGGAPTMPTLSQAATSRGGSVQLTYAPQNDFSGASAQTVAQLKQQQDQDRKLMEARVVSIVKNARQRGVQL